MKFTVHIVAILCLLSLLSMSAVCPVMADDDPDMDYEGELDIESGKPVGQEEESEQTRISLGSSVYDRDKRQYLYTVGTVEVGMNLPSGVITTSKICLTVPDGMLVKLYRDGEEDTEQDLTSITKTGSYIVRFGDDEQSALTFTIVGEKTGMVNEYRMPEGFRVISVKLNAQSIAFTSNVVDMTGEGKYEIQYKCTKTGIVLELSVTVDHTPPTLKLEAVNERGYASGPVDISDFEKGTAISVYLNDEYMSYTETLTKSGRYRIVLADAAGNRTTYNFTIRVYFDFNAVMFIVVALALAGALTAYLVLSRRKMRIR